MELWLDYEERAVTYNGLLIEIGELAPDLDAAQGFVPAEIAETVRRQSLDLALLKASLRGYQALAQSLRSPSDGRSWVTRWASAKALRHSRQCATSRLREVSIFS